MLAHRQIMVVILGLSVTQLLAALDNTIISVALPVIAGKMGDFAKLPWIGISYTLTATVATLILGKLSDLYGRRRLFLFAVATFLVGSFLCGAAQTVDQLIVFRGIQGIGGGGIFSLAMAVTGEIISPRERGRYFGYFTAQFAIAAIAGPLVGGFLVEHTSWRWIFYVNLPLGIVALVVVARVLKLPFRRVDARLDWSGTFLVVGAVTTLMLALERGNAIGWRSPEIIGLFATSAVLTACFVWVEQRAPEPLLPLRLFANDVVRNCCLLAFFLGMMMFGVFYFLPIFFQDAKFDSPTVAGLKTVPLMLGMLFASNYAGRQIVKTGRYVHLPRTGLAGSMVGVLVLSRISTGMPYPVMAAGMLLAGVGMGMSMPTANIASQNAVDMRDLGVTTALLNFVRQLAGAVGLAVFGALFNARVTDRLSARVTDAGEGLAVLKLIRDPKQIEALPPAQRDAVIDSLISGLQLVCTAGVLTIAACWAAAFLIRELPLRQTSAMAAPAMD